MSCVTNQSAFYVRIYVGDGGIFLAVFGVDVQIYVGDGRISLAGFGVGVQIYVGIYIYICSDICR